MGDALVYSNLTQAFPCGDEKHRREDRYQPVCYFPTDVSWTVNMGDGSQHDPGKKHQHEAFLTRSVSGLPLAYPSL